jgi:hypothetical protein
VDGAYQLDEDPCRLSQKLDLGRKDAAFALREVGATSTTDRGSSSFAWTITPYRRRCCS